MLQPRETSVVTPADVCAIEELARQASSEVFTEDPICCGMCGLKVASDSGVGKGPRVVRVSTGSSDVVDTSVCRKGAHLPRAQRKLGIHIAEETVRIYQHLK